MAFHKAVREEAWLRLALCGLAGRGKTFSGLAILCELARLTRESGRGPGRVAVIDTERGSAKLYATEFDFDVCELTSFSPLTYVAAIKDAEAAGYDHILLDSISHAWAGKDGALEQKDTAAARSQSGNSWTAWRDVSPKHNALVDAMLGSSAHLVATMRVKMEYAQEKDEKTGKTSIKKVGLAAIQREGMDYEFTLVGDIDDTHTMKVAKTRIHGVVELNEMFEKPGAAFARKLYGWLMSGAKPAPLSPPTSPRRRDLETAALEARSEEVHAIRQPPGAVTDAIDQAFSDYLATMAAATTIRELDAAVAGPGAPAKGSPDRAIAAAEYRRLKAALPVTTPAEAPATAAEQVAEPVAVAS